MSLTKRYRASRKGWETRSCRIRDKRATAEPDARASAAEAVLALLAEELGLARREEVVHPVRLADEEQVVDPRRPRGGTNRGKTRVRDRRRRQPKAPPRVVRTVALEIGLLERLGARDVPPVANRRVDPERHPLPKAVVDHGRDEATLLGSDRLLLDHRRDRENVVRRQVLRLRIAEIDAPPLPPEERELIPHEPRRRGQLRELVGRGKEEAFARASSRPVLAELRRRHGSSRWHSA